MFDIKENLKKLPDCPGVYMHKDKLGQVIYVGKAISLRNRVRQYFQASANHSPKVKAMVSHIAEFEYITCQTEMEALILECNLIKKYAPKYNVLLRDDKTYPYIKVTVSEKFPRVLKTRLITKDGSRYFGPYSDAGAVNDIIELLNNIYVLKRCAARSFPEGYRPCLNYHINRCRGICTGEVSEQEYREHIQEVILFDAEILRPREHIENSQQESGGNDNAVPVDILPEGRKGHGTGVDLDAEIRECDGRREKHGKPSLAWVMCRCLRRPYLFRLAGKDRGEKGRLVTFGASCGYSLGKHLFFNHYEHTLTLRASHCAPPVTGRPNLRAAAFEQLR